MRRRRPPSRRAGRRRGYPRSTFCCSAAPLMLAFPKRRGRPRPRQGRSLLPPTRRRLCSDHLHACREVRSRTCALAGGNPSSSVQAGRDVFPVATHSDARPKMVMSRAAGRRDPDGTGVRMALTRKVTVNSMGGGGWKKLFRTTCLTKGWVGPGAPALPQGSGRGIVAAASRDAEKKARPAVVGQASRKALPPLRVRIVRASRPSLAFYVFRCRLVVAFANERQTDDK